MVMPHENEKTAAVVAKNVNDLINLVKAHGGKDAENAVRNTLFRKGGSGSLLVDYGSKLFGKKFSKNVGDKYSKVQEKLTDIDIKTGKKIYDKLQGKGKYRDKLSKGFVNKHTFEVGEPKPGSPDKKIEVGVPGVTAPLEKAQRTALPLIGAFTVGSKITDVPNSSGKEGRGDEKVKKQADKRQVLIEKIASMLSENKGDNEIDIHIQQDDRLTKLSTLASIASKMLKYAASENKRIIAENEKLAFENQKLNSELEHKTKFDMASKLATLMNEKGMIKKADIDVQTNKIMELDEAGCEMLKSAVENLNISDLRSKDGVDNLTFLGENISINDSRGKKATLADSIEEAINGK